MWCAGGGKESNVLRQTHAKWFHSFMCQEDFDLLRSRYYHTNRKRRLEAPAQTAVREYCEEHHADIPFSSGFLPNDFSDVYTVGSLADNSSGIPYDIHFVIGRVHRKGFSLSPREALGFQPLNTIDPNQVVPITRSALGFMARAQQYRPRFGESEKEIKYRLSSPLRTIYRSLDLTAARGFVDTPKFTPNEFEIDTGNPPHEWSVKNICVPSSSNEEVWNSLLEFQLRTEENGLKIQYDRSLATAQK